MTTVGTDFVDRAMYAPTGEPRYPAGSAATTRRYLMCRPTHFAVEYAINPWMRPDTTVDVDRATEQWERLRQTYLELGHQVELIEPIAGLPDMVFAANGGLVVDGHVLGARFAFSERRAEGPAYLRWFAEFGPSLGLSTVHEPVEVNEGEGDFLVVGDLILAGTGFRTTVAAHREAADRLGHPVVSLELIDPRFYHLDTALAVLDEQTIAYYPDALTARSRARLVDLFPDALQVGAADAGVLGLNAVSDGHHVVLPREATGMARQLVDRGFRPVPVDVSELRKAGGGPKCATLEIRP